MSAPLAPRCGKRIRNWKICGRPAGHSGGHLSEEVWQRGLDRVAKKRADGLTIISTHGYSGYGRGCRCPVCTDAKADYMRDRRTAATASAGRPVTGVTHGTRYAYEERGCRCDRCVEAERTCSRGHRPQRVAS